MEFTRSLTETVGFALARIDRAFAEDADKYDADKHSALEEIDTDLNDVFDRALRGEVFWDQDIAEATALVRAAEGIGTAGHLDIKDLLREVDHGYARQMFAERRHYASIALGQLWLSYFSRP